MRYGFLLLIGFLNGSAPDDEPRVHKPIPLRWVINQWVSEMPPPPTPTKKHPKVYYDHRERKWIRLPKEYSGS